MWIAEATTTLTALLRTTRPTEASGAIHALFLSWLLNSPTASQLFYWKLIDEIEARRHGIEKKMNWSSSVACRRRPTVTIVQEWIFANCPHAAAILQSKRGGGMYVIAVHFCICENREWTTTMMQLGPLSPPGKTVSDDVGFGGVSLTSS